ncbi:hypothetical protein E2C01_007211 [Portunus trituberculatus]|uniref:Uncharacterized protein n=1 Tax=Portunus trituberculatus TaxID=210409 RepID=A0A5B7D0A8_PORTR|nr:hypothetical protein [Portunus trituberculatus]
MHVLEVQDSGGRYILTLYTFSNSETRFIHTVILLLSQNYGPLSGHGGGRDNSQALRVAT